MFGSVHELALRPRSGISRFALTHAGFAGAVFLIELSAIGLVAILTGLAYHLGVYGVVGSIENYAAVGLLAGLGYALAFLVRDEYGIESLLEGRRNSGRIFLVWNLAFVGLAVVGFLSKSTQIYSRGWLLLFYVVGLAAVIGLNFAAKHAVARLIAQGWIRRRKLMLVATDVDVQRLEAEIAAPATGFAVTARVALPHLAQEGQEIDAALEAAVANARALGIEDVIISNSLSRADFLERSVKAFSVLPVSLHLSTTGLVGRFRDARLARFGEAAALSLTRAPLGPFEAFAKRSLDIAASAIALVLLAPLFAMIALFIKCDSPGPVFFLQRRRGYNTAEFDIWKFRTMRHGNHAFRQATANDDRVTAVGRFLRRYSLDELPQLVNVLRGEMSLVGPRPHAVAHDEFFEKRIAEYPRRLNVKPGITGWAQVNGFRGETATDEAMQARVDHDLYYIDNCSFGFDLYILLLTVVSPKASRNAY